ncbi:MAG: tetratricopeptide repeat protein, partial [Mariprofundaceae bacterium]|nr:tetratricopeptide repeat protein [Mariprofundaceae bacterium]
MKVLAKVFYILTLLVVCSWQVQAESVNDQAKQALSLGRVAVATDLLSKQVQSEPRDYQAWFLLGVAEARDQHFHQAIEAFRRVIELRNDLAEPHNNLAVIYNELGDVKAAVVELEQSLKKHPGYLIAEENIADLYVKLALQYYKKALLKRDDATLMQRYTRLLHVRDPNALGDTQVATQQATQ